MNGPVMGDIQPASYAVMMPELYLAGWTLFLLVYCVYRLKEFNHFLLFVCLLMLGVTAGLAAFGFSGRAVVMNGMFITDRFAAMAKCILLVASMLALSLGSGWLKEGGGRPFEFCILLLFSTLGMMLLVSAADMLALYMALELMSLPLYVLASFSRDDTKSSEAGLKYFVLGALASGMLLFGMSLIYGFSGTLSFNALAMLFAEPGQAVSPGVVAGLVFVMVGLCFKLSAVPFHMWAPDVYEGAPTPVTAFFATAPKVAAMALLARVLMQPFGDLFGQWQQVVIAVSLASMMLGALAAIVQTNIKRLLAYSSIGHAGFMLMGLAAGDVAGVQAVLIYLAVYIFMSAGAFGCVLLMRRGGHYVEDIRDLAGLSRAQPALALALSAFMFSMAGIPPLAGFFGKMYVVLAAIGAGLAWLAVIGVATSVIAGYYYIKIVKIMYFDEPAKGFDTDIPAAMRAGIALCAAVTLFFFLAPTPLVAQAKLAAEALLQ